MPRTGPIVSGIVVVYSALTLLCALVYLFAGMSGFEAVNHAMTTLSTGGFSTHDTSLAYYDSAPMIEWICIIFMIAGALPFVLYLRLFLQGSGRIFHDSQVRSFFILLGGLISLISLWLWQTGEMPFLYALRQAAFNITSILTTTGYVSTDYMLWGPFAVLVFFFITYIGACTGSTTGGLKIMRLEILALHGRNQIKRLLYPHGIFTAMYNHKPLPRHIVISVLVFSAIYVTSNTVLTLLLALTGVDFLTAVSGAATSLANVGPGLGPEIGPAGNFANLPDAAKWLLSAGMLLGRLELMTVLILFHPGFWRD